MESLTLESPDGTGTAGLSQPTVLLLYDSVQTLPHEESPASAGREGHSPDCDYSTYTGHQLAATALITPRVCSTSLGKEPCPSVSVHLQQAMVHPVWGLPHGGLQEHLLSECIQSLAAAH